MTTQRLPSPPQKQSWRLPLLVGGTAVIWVILWGQLQNLADWVTYRLIGLSPETHLGESVNFFFYDVPKILLLLTGMTTFANAQKITADLEAITGDPDFVNNFRNLVNGLSNLVSSVENLEQEVDSSISFQSQND